MITNTFKINSFNIFCDAPEAWQFGFQDPATPAAEGMILFYNSMSLYLIIIAFLVCWMLSRIIFLFNNKSNKVPQIFTHASWLEILWTVIPSIVLLLISIPSFSLLYSLEETTDPSVTLKIIGHQWYWSYEYSVGKKDKFVFESYLSNLDDMYYGGFRLLETDNRIYLPINSYIRLLITSSDVLHSWAVPSFGIKVDACPGRLSQSFLYIKRSGVYYGQCSEICGVNHGFMPIVVVGTSKSNYNFFMEMIAGGPQ
jgi:cytochrome c oxidase subunit 2